MTTKDYVKLIRPHQWYKNLLVFIPLLFASTSAWPWDTLPAVFNFANYPPLLLGFLSLAALSSAGYIINDLQDFEKDAAHPEKKYRPIPSGKVSRNSALILATGLIIGSLTLAYLLNGIFFLLTIFYFVNAQIYNYITRKAAIIDVVTIAVGFIIRAVSGAFLLVPIVPFTSWLIIGVFFFALILGFGKRKNELQLLGEDAAEHKPVFKFYNKEILDQGIMMSSTWVVLFYALYCYEAYGHVMDTQPIMLTIPIAASLIMRYVYLIQIGSPVGRKPHLAIKDKGIFIGGLIFMIVLMITLFFWVPFYNFFYTLFPPLFPFPPIFP
ncbi:MAG: UbiA prenyltransferase family protein [Candidatus Thorarchaeota archaeon]